MLASAPLCTHRPPSETRERVMIGERLRGWDAANPGDLQGHGACEGKISQIEQC
jgi:hypothetical protein